MAEDRIIIECTKTFKKKLKLYCAEKDISIKEFVTNIVKEKINF